MLFYEYLGSKLLAHVSEKPNNFFFMVIVQLHAKQLLNDTYNTEYVKQVFHSRYPYPCLFERNNKPSRIKNALEGKYIRYCSRENDTYPIAHTLLFCFVLSVLVYRINLCFTKEII